MTAPPSPRGGGYETPWARHYPAGVPRTYPYPAVGAVRLLEDAANDFPDAIAVEYRRYRLSYRKLLDHVDRLATALSDLGVGAGTGVAVLLPNCPQLIIALFATWRLGGHVTLLTPRSDNASLAATDPKIVIVIDRWYAKYVAPHRPALDASARVVITGVGDYLPFPDNVLVPVRQLARRRPLRIPETEGVLGFADLVRRNLPTAPGADAAEDAPALTSLHDSVSQRQLVVNSFQLRLWLPDVVAGDERVLLGLPLSSTLGALWILTSVLAAATMILVDDRRASVRQREAMHARATLLPVDQRLGDVLLPPSRRHIGLASRWRDGLTSVRIALARDALEPERRHALEELTDKGRIRRAWGVHGLLTHADPIYGRYEEGTVGLPLPDTAAVVADPSRTDRPAPTDCRGRLWLRGPQLRGDEWVDAGIDASFDADGYLTVYEE